MKKNKHGFLTIDELGLVTINLTNGQFTVGCFGSAVASGEIIDHKAEYLVTCHAFKSWLDSSDIRDGVAVISGPFISLILKQI